MQKTHDHRMNLYRTGIFGLLGLAVLTLTFAVFSGGCGGTACTTAYIPALRVMVVKADGTNVTGNPDLVIEYRHHGDQGQGQWQECMFAGETVDENVTRVRCGLDQGGEYDVRANLAGLSGQKMGLGVYMDKDGCHAIPRDINITVE